MTIRDIGVNCALSGKQRQTITNIVQTGHGSERIIDCGRHGPDGNLSKLINSIFDILGRCALVSKMEGVSDFVIHVVINPISRPNLCNHHATPDKGAWLGNYTDHYILFFGEGKDVFRIYILDIPGFICTNRTASAVISESGGLLAVSRWYSPPRVSGWFVSRTTSSNSTPAVAAILGAWSMVLICWMSRMSEAKATIKRYMPMVVVI